MCLQRAVSEHDTAGVHHALWRFGGVGRGAAGTNVKTQGLPGALVDRVQLQQVVINLIRNAIDAMNSIADGHRILRIGTERNEAGEVIISIEDPGAGLNPNDTDKIFAPFFTTKWDGMGMGLSICRSILEAHGGRLSAAPSRSQRAVFEIALLAHGGRSAGGALRKLRQVNAV
jgi:C4-dicarboxylate-specific signal transduction histidine kinase